MRTVDLNSRKAKITKPTECLDAGDLQLCTVHVLCAAVLLGSDKIKKLVKMMKQVNMIIIILIRLRNVPGSL